MVERILIEASLRSDFGVQRLSRGEPNQLSHVSLLPRESASEVKGHHVRWLGIAFWYDALGSGIATWLTSPTGPIPIREMVSGDRFVIGTTTVEFEFSLRKWPVDLERERALLARDDVAAWSIYVDELLLRGDPLASALARTGEFDIPFQLDVSPLIASGSVSVVTDDRGLWREITLRSDGRDDLRIGPIDAVLSHPRAWFVRRVSFESGILPRNFLMNTVRSAMFQVERSAGPFLEVFSLPGYPEDEALPHLREGVRVDRAE